MQFRAPVGEQTGFAVREAVDKDLEELARLIEAQQHLPPPAPAWLEQRAALAAGGAQPDAASPGAVRVTAAQSGRRRDQLRAGWGAHIKSQEHMPGGLR